ncbi:hypothetical protein EMCRGX_G029026 [Ephydatia muelleri]
MEQSFVLHKRKELFIDHIIIAFLDQFHTIHALVNIDLAAEELQEYSSIIHSSIIPFVHCWLFCFHPVLVSGLSHVHVIGYFHGR